MNMASNIPLPGPLKITGDISSNWKRFKSQWTNYELATDLTEDTPKRTAIFLSCIGSEAYDVFESMVFDNEEDRLSISKVIAAFEQHCIGETNITYERYILNKRVQEDHETFDNFLTDIRRLAKSCEYGTLTESLLKDRIVIGIRDDGTRRKLLQTRKLDLATAIDVCRATEAATRHLRDFKGTEDVNKVVLQNGRQDQQLFRSREKSRDSRDRTPGDRDKSYDSRNQRYSPNDRKCKYCGKVHQKGSCGAYGKFCDFCGIKNHLSSVCMAKSKRQSIRLLNHDGDVEEDDEEILVLTSGKQHEFKRKLFARLKVGETLIRFQLDCGATVNILSEDIAIQTLSEDLKLRPPKANIRMFDNTQLKTLGMVTISVINPKLPNNSNWIFISPEVTDSLFSDPKLVS